MKNNNEIPTIKGMPLEIFQKYNREYARINPYSLAGIRPMRRRIIRLERVFSTQSAGNDLVD